MESNVFDEIFQPLFLNFYKMYPDMQAPPINVIVTNSLSETNYELRPDLETALITQGIEKYDNNNGRMVLPKNVVDSIHILLNANNIIKYTNDGSMTWIGTFAHELTHAIDYHLLALKENLSIYDLLLRTENYYMFQIWSEYHARRLGYKFLRSQLGVGEDSFSKEEQIEHIFETEMPFHLKSYFEDYHATTDGHEQIYSTMQLLGRFSAWRDLFPEFFNDQMVRKIFENATWLYDIFEFLSGTNSVDDIYYKFEEMRIVLRENWKGL